MSANYFYSKRIDSIRESDGKIVIDVGKQSGGNEWDGGALRWDYCLTFPKAVPEDKNVVRRAVLHDIKEAGLTISKTYSRDDDEIFIRITATLPIFEEKAEIMKLEIKKRPEYGGGFSVFDRSTKYQFESDGPAQFFTSSQRIQIIQFVLEAPKHEGGAEIDLDQLVHDKYMNSAFPLHADEDRAYLIKHWARSFFRRQPLEKIMQYFGPKVAMYFGYLGFYTSWLAIVGVAGAAAAFFQYTDYGPRILAYDPVTAQSEYITPPSYDGKATPIYCIFLCLAVTLFLEGWKREQASLACSWNQHEFEQTERLRPEYKGELAYGFWSADGDWIGLEDIADNAQTEVDKTILLSKFAKRSYSLMVGAWIVVTCWVFIVIVACLALLAFKHLLKVTKGSTYAAVGGGLSFSLFIQITNQLYRRVAIFLTNKENHRTETNYEDALVSKVFLFQFVNSYVSFFYIAFVKRSGVVIFGRKQDCMPAVETGPPNCMYELNKQLSWIFIFQILIGNFLEVLLPWTIGRIKMCCEGIKLKKAGNVEAKPLSTAEHEAKLSVYLSPFDDYNEMIIQFGFVTLFAAGFPLAALLALVNNLIEIRSDATKLLFSTRRPPFAGAQDIGTWFSVLEVMSTLSVITNTLILCYTSSTLDELFAGQSDPTLKKILVAIAVEHLVFLLKWAIAKFVPDVPESVRKQIAKDEFMRELELQAHQFVLAAPAGKPSGSAAVISSGYLSEPTDTEE